MATIGGVTIPDNLLPSFTPPAPPRPGIGAVLSGAAQGAYGQVRYGLPYAVGKMAGTLAPGDEDFYRQGLQASEAASQAAPIASVGDLTSGKVGIGRFIGENLAGSLPYMAGGLVGGLAGGAIAGPGGAVVGAIAGGSPAFAGMNVSRAVAENGGLSQDTAEKSLLVSPFQSAAEAAIGRFVPGAGHVIGDMAAGDIAGGFLKRTATAVAKSAGTGALAMAGQTMAGRVAAGDSLTTADAAAELVNSAVTGGLVGGVMGAAGGFKRTAAVSKPAAEVTNADITDHINEILNPQPIAALPAPSAFGRPDFAPDFTTDAAGRTAASPADLRAAPVESAPVAPPHVAAPALPSPDAFGRVPTGPEVTGAPIVVDAAGRAVPAPDAGALRAEPLPGTPIPVRQLQLEARPDVGGPADLTSLPLAVDAAGRAVPDTTEGRRTLLATPIDHIRTLLTDKTSSPEIKDEARREVAARFDEANGTAPLTTDNFQTRLDDVKSGLKGGWVTKLDAATPKELVDKVYDRIFTDSDTTSNVTKLAQRLGLLDEKLEPTDLSNQIEADRAAPPTDVAPVEAPAAPADDAQAAQPQVPTPEAAPVAPVTPEEANAGLSAEAPETVAPPVSSAPATIDPDFAPQWDQIKADAGIERNSASSDVLSDTPPNLASAQSRVFGALADDDSGAAVSQTEKVARKMGLITDDDKMDVTPLGRKAFLHTADGADEVSKAARQQGYAGADASNFDRGVRAITTGEDLKSFGEFKDMAAYQAGKVWAQDFVAKDTTATAKQSDAIQARVAARTTGTAVDRRVVAEREKLSPHQVERQGLNRLLDAADLRNVNDSDVAALRRMVRENASPEEVGKALQDVQGGKTLFREPESVRPDLARPDGRGQPLFKELNTPEERTPAKAEQRAQTEPAVQAYDARNLIEFAKREGGITDVRAAKLHDMLDQGKVDQVRKLLKDFDPDAQPKPRGERLPTPPETVFDKGQNGLSTGDADHAFEQSIAGKDTVGMIDQMIKDAPSAFNREVMKQIKALTAKLDAAGIKVDVKLVHPGDTVPRDVNRSDIRALTRSELNPPRSTVYLKGAELGGTNYQLAAHEMVHAVADRLVQWGSRPENAGTKIGKDVKDLNDLMKSVISHFNERAAGGTLDPFEKAFYERNNNALANARELLAWGLTNPDMQRYLQSIEYAPKQSVFGKLVGLVRKLLGIDGKYDTALTELLRVSERVMKPGQEDIISSHALNNASGFDSAVAEPTISSPAQESAANRTVGATNDTTSKFAEGLERFADRINPKDLSVKARRAFLGWISHVQMTRQFEDRVPEIRDHEAAHAARTALRGRIEHMGESGYQEFEQLQKASPKMAESTMRLMAAATEFQMDPDKTWAEHTWLHDAPNAAALERLHTELRGLKNDISRGDGAGKKTFDNMRALNESQRYMHLAVELHGLVANDPELRQGIENSWANPADKFMAADGTTVETPQQIRDHWEQSLNEQVGNAMAFIRQKNGEAAQGTAGDQNAMRQHLSPVQEKINSIMETKAAMAKAPYFHLGRFGDNYGSATIAKLADGTVDPVAQRKVAEALDKAGFKGIQISADNTKPKLAMRFDTVDQTERFRELAIDLQKQGLLSPDKIEAGPRDERANLGTATDMPAWLSKYIQNLDHDPSFTPGEGATAEQRAALGEAKAAAAQLARDTWVEGQPDSSISRVLSARQTISGYDPDMIRNFAHRWRVGSISIANTASAPKFNKAFEGMNARFNEAKISKVDEAGNPVPREDPYLVQDLANELKMRDAKTPVNALADSFDKVRAFSNSFYLGMSPAYNAINLMQIGTNALPELAKKNGYTASFHALRRATPQAFSILKAVASEANKAGWKHLGDVAITDNVLRKAGLDDQTRAFVTKMLATGTIDIGSMARSLGQIAEGHGTGGALDTYLKLSSGFSLYTESFSRLVTALAARDLHGSWGEDAQGYAAKTVNEAMFNYQTWNTARQLGKKGFLGPVTPIVTQFMSYSAQMTEKLMSEAMDAFAKPRAGETVESAAARKSEARTFLLGHLTAITALTGTLGLPFATAFAGALSKLVGTATGNDQYDATASYRNFLASVLGKDVGEVVSRGVPHALGFDISQRAGEQNLLPMSEFLTSSRSWKDAAADQAGRGIGAAPSMLISILDGGHQIARGDVLGGMKAMLPVAFKGPTEAYRMATEGYIDTKGNKLPMDPKASAIMWQLLGFSPSAKAEYSEARGDEVARRQDLTTQANQMRSQIVRAMRSGDLEAAKPLIQSAMEFDKANPTFAVVPSVANALAGQEKAQAVARATHTPIGVNIKDLGGRSLSQYANF